MRTGLIRSEALALSLMLTLVGVGCAEDTAPPMGDDDFPLSPAEPLYADAPADRGMSLPFDAKADETLPERFDLLEYQTPIRSQGRRGTCTIFATTALMESLYVREGSIAEPDFSEQFLQWSAKFEVGSFPNSAGSNPYNNLQAINRFGIVEEDLWPYEASQWGPDDDPECTGDDQPTRCYTNGEPPDEALMAERFTLPRGQWINPSHRSIQGHMVSTRTPVVVSGDFFYQSWNHGRSNLVTNSDYQANGYVLAPNEADIEDSSGDRRAGHGFLLVGWNDELSVPRVDGEGNEIMGEDGEPEMETGFFLFKNSWGTGRFGRNLPNEESGDMGGPGYGWISYRYVEEHLTAYVAGLPEVTLTEICNDGRDNDRNGQADCDDAACSGDRSCMDPGDSLRNDTPVDIPDDDPSGASSTIEVTEPGTISSLAVDVDITHTYRGDLRVTLVSPSGEEALLFDRDGGSQDDLVETFTTAAFNGLDAEGTWELVVSDNAGADTGTLNSWSMEITRCESDCGGSERMIDEIGEADLPIPDDDSLSTSIEIMDSGEITSMNVSVDITHTFPYELTVRLAQEGGREFVLVQESTEDGGIDRSFEVPGFVGEDIGGTWTLTVVDGAPADTGTLNGWSIQASVR
ncbi:MAG TPA: proprotein convertase P-domain-containing protein [Sandaracinaceae bacterium LLY-WYZ-13_1]|nr:proprotein convertase P-domain-containing protein [Sandaracinaceae bacterium LLY-WYZ-13_1]